MAVTTVAWLALCALAASDEPDEEVEVIGERPGVAEVSASVTVIEVDERLPQDSDLADVIATAPGASVHRLGGLGDWSAVSIRGSTTRQVEVFLDGVPLNPEGGSTVDLSELPLRAFSRVEVYRGGGPPELGAAAIGGVVNLVTGDEPATNAALAAGSLGTVRGHVAASHQLGGSDLWLAADGFSTGGGFSYFDDGGTPYDLLDDRTRTRDNNDKRQLSAHARLRLGDQVQWTLLNAFVGREEGVPGFTFAPLGDVRYSVVRDLQVVEVTGVSGPTRLSGRLWFYGRNERFDDRAAEITGGASWSGDRTLSGGGRTWARWAPAPSFQGGAALELRGDDYRSTDLLADSVGLAHSRTVGKAAVFATMRRGAASATPVLQLVGLVDRPDRDLVTGERPPDRSDLALAPRLGVLVRAAPQLALKANAGRFFRPPDLLELFGDRGPFVGNPELRSESGWQLDAGARWEVDGGVVGAVEATAFAVDTQDAIVFVQGAQGRARPDNLAATRVLGVEAAVSLTWWGWVESLSTLTRSLSTDRSDDPAYAGNQIPRVPAWELYQRTALVRGPVRVGHTYSYTDGEYWDRTNWFRAAPRSLHGAFARYTHAGLSAELGVLNLGDRLAEVVPRNPLVDDGARVVQPITDFAGYPLPGRTVLLTLGWTR